jgi:methanesulfonate monooxygenase large subunit
MPRNETQWQNAPSLQSREYVSSEIYNNETIFAEEIEKIHRRTWKFVCHESEVPLAGDYRTIDHTGVPLVVIRGEDGEIRTFINACSHRGALVARGLSGNAKKLICFFHLWAYDTKGNCVEMTRPEGFEKCGLSKADTGLRQVRTETRLGLVFVNLDDKAMSLSDYLGDALEWFEEPMGTVPLEVFHYNRGMQNANWKQWHETNMELYHEWGHVVNRTTSVAAKGYHERLWRIYPNGHGSLEPLRVQYKNYKGWENRDDQLLPGLTSGEFRVLDIFPNTTIIIRATTIRIDTSTPIAPGKTLVEHRGLGVLGEPQNVRADRQKQHNQFWGPFGRNLSEDVIFVESVNRGIADGGMPYGLFCRHENMMSQDDEIMRAYYDVWGEHMGRQASNPLNAKRAAKLVRQGA